MNDRDLMQEALDALESLQAWPETPENFKRFRAIEALRARLAQPEPAQCDGGQCGIGGYCKECPKTQPEPKPDYEAEFIKDWNEGKVRRVSDGKRMVPEREWVGLTDEEIIKLQHLIDWTAHWSTKKFARAIEAKLKEKNG